MADIEKLRSDWEKAERKAYDIAAKADESRQRYAERIREAWDAAAAAQKELNDAEAAQALVGRDDAETVASNLGLTLPE